MARSSLQTATRDCCVDVCKLLITATTDVKVDTDWEVEERVQHTQQEMHRHTVKKKRWRWREVELVVAHRSISSSRDKILDSYTSELLMMQCWDRGEAVGRGVKVDGEGGGFKGVVKLALWQAAMMSDAAGTRQSGEHSLPLCMSLVCLYRWLFEFCKPTCSHTKA